MNEKIDRLEGIVRNSAAAESDLRAVLAELEVHRRPTHRNELLISEIRRQLRVRSSGDRTNVKPAPSARQDASSLVHPCQPGEAEAARASEETNLGADNSDLAIGSTSCRHSAFDPTRALRDQTPALDVISALPLLDLDWVPESIQRPPSRSINALLESLGWRGSKPTWSIIAALSPSELARQNGLGARSVAEILDFLRSIADHVQSDADSLRQPEEPTTSPVLDSRVPLFHSVAGARTIEAQPGLTDAPGTKMSAEGRPTALTMNPVWLLHLETVLAWAEEVSPEPTLERALAASTGDLVPEDVTLARLYLMGGPVGVADSQLPVAQQIDELLGHVDSRSKDVLFSRLFSNQAETLSAVGETLGVTRERVRQIEKRSLEKLLAAMTHKSRRGLRWKVHRLSTELGTIAPLHHQATADAIEHVMGGETLSDAYVNVLLWLAGPYELNEGEWLTRNALSLSRIESSLIATCDEHGILEENPSRVLSNLGCSQPFHEAIVSSLPNIRGIDGRLVRWSGKLEDKAITVLAIRGEPMSPQEIVAKIGEDHNVRGAASRIQADPRFSRTGKASYGLAEWGHHEYQSITAAIRDALDEAGKPLSIVALERELSKRFDVSRSSVRTFCSAALFVVEDGYVRLRRVDESVALREDVDAVKGVFDYNDRVVVIVPVDREVLRGSGRQIGLSLAARLGVEPGARKVYRGDDGDIAISWPTTGFSGSLGSLRGVVNSLGLADGQQVRLRLFPDTGFVDAAPVSQPVVDRGPSVEAVRELTGAKSEDVDDLIRELSTALGTTETGVRRALRRRGDDLVADLLPVETAVNLGSALDELDAAFSALPDDQ